MKFTISVIMGIYNCGNTLEEALNSLINQTYQDFKVIMCDDGSCDNTVDIAKKYVEKYPEKFILIKNKKNMGLNYTLNRCLELVDTEYLARMDGDDISLPERFEVELNFIKKNQEYVVVSTPCTYFDENGVFRKGTGSGHVKKMQFLRRPPISHAPCLAKTAVFKEVGGYTVSSKLLRVEDYHLWFKIFSKGYNMYQMPDSYYMMRDDRKAKKRRTWKSRFNEVYVKHIGYKMIGIPWYYQIYILEPLVRQMLPDFLYQYLRRRKMKKSL